MEHAALRKLTMRTLIALTALLLPTAAFAQGARLAERIETEKNKKTRAKLTAKAEKLKGAQKETFVTWAVTRRRAQKKPWRRLGKALGKIGTASAAEELGIVARYTTEEKGWSKVSKSALEALTSMNPDTSVPVLMKGVTHADRGVRTRHKKYFTRFLAEGTVLARDGALRAIVRIAERMERKRTELLEAKEEEEDVDAELRKLKKDEEIMVSMITDAITASNYLNRHLYAVANPSRPRMVQIAAARGISKRSSARLAPLRREVRKVRKQREREAKRKGEDPEALSDEDARRAAYKSKPHLQKLYTAVMKERSRLEEALLSLSETEIPEVRYEIAIALPAVRKGLTQAWSELMFPLLSSKKTEVIVAVAKALTSLTGETKPAQNRRAWEAWWKTQEGSEEDEE